MLRKAMVGMAIVGLSAVDAYSVLQKRDGAHAHDHGHAAAAPSDGYGEPAASYGAPAASYSEPSPSYGEPAASYGEPAPAYGAEEAALPDLTPIIIGILALVGLSLLFPTFVSVSSRKKRSAAEGKTNLHKEFSSTKIASSFHRFMSFWYSSSAHFILRSMHLVLRHD